MGEKLFILLGFADILVTTFHYIHLNNVKLIFAKYIL